MFITSHSLQTTYGIDEKIATFFVDREPPANNLYWHEKLLYLRPSPGYLFIPLIVDLFYKAGIELQQLLADKFVTTMEQIGHLSALQEVGQISNDEAVKKGAELVETSSINKDYYNHLLGYFSNNQESLITALATPFTALHRGDIFLFAICSLEFPNTLTTTLVEQWFALITTLLLLDDLDDIEIDKARGDENAFLEAGLNFEGVQKLLGLVRDNLKKISVLNSTMAAAFNKQYNQLIVTHPVFQL